MTVGIGVVCDEGDSIILAGDMRVTYCGMDVDPHDRAGKLYEFSPFNLSAAIAGTTSSTHAIISEFCVYLKAYCQAKLKEPEKVLRFEHIRDSLEFARKKEMRRLQECEMQSQLGCSLSDWLTGKLPTGEKFNEIALRWGTQVLRSVRKDFRNKVGIIVAGHIEVGPIFLRALGFEPVEEAPSPANYVIGGKGAVAALEHLNKRKQNIEMGLARSVLHVHEAMKASKIDKGVGDPAHYVVLRPWTVSRPQGMLRIDGEHPTLKQWAKDYRKKDTDGLEVREANDLIQRALFPSTYLKKHLLGPRELIGKL